jgi:hypothetical protein
MGKLTTAAKAARAISPQTNMRLPDICIAQPGAEKSSDLVREKRHPKKRCQISDAKQFGDNARGQGRTTDVFRPIAGRICRQPALTVNPESSPRFRKGKTSTDHRLTKLHRKPFRYGYNRLALQEVINFKETRAVVGSIFFKSPL